MSQQLGNEVETQGKTNKSTTPRTALSFQRKEEELPWVGFEPLQSRRALYQLNMHVKGRRAVLGVVDLFVLPSLSTSVPIVVDTVHVLNSELGICGGLITQPIPRVPG